jgi:hypothetical protein
MLGITAFTAAVAVAIPGWSASIDGGQIAHWKASTTSTTAALSLLIDAPWTEGEARERGIVVSENRFGRHSTSRDRATTSCSRRARRSWTGRSRSRWRSRRRSA